MQRHVVMFSGGAGSWATAKRVVAEHGPDDVTLLFADTLIEDDDLYRFLGEAADNVGARLEVIAEGRDPWQVFFDVRYLGNTRVDPCSARLKREYLRKWVDAERDAADTVLHFGIDWTEAHRLGPLRFNHAHTAAGCPDRKACRRGEPCPNMLEVPWRVEAPLTQQPLLDKQHDVLPWMRREGVTPPRLYALGFPHNNCAGFCIKGGQAQFELLWRNFPDLYRYHERREQQLRRFLGHTEACRAANPAPGDWGSPVREAWLDDPGCDCPVRNVAILRDRTDKKTRPLTMRAFRERLEVNPLGFDQLEFGGCGCAV